MSALKANRKAVFILTGSSIVVMAIIAGVVVGGYFQPMTSLSPKELFYSLQNSSNSFRWGIFGWVSILICDLIAAWGLMEVFKPQFQSWAVLTGWLRFLYAAILAIAIACLILIVPIVESTEMSLTNAEELTTILFKGYLNLWSFGLLIIGFHLIGVGVLAYLEKQTKKWLSILVMLAGVGYVITNLMQLVMPNYGEIKPIVEGVFMLPMIVGEVGFGVWLMIRGIKNVSLD